MRHINSGLVVALALAAPLAGCDPGGPNGLNGVLFFRGGGPEKVGAVQAFSIPANVTIGGYTEGKGLVYVRSETFRFDFSGTTIEVVPPQGAVVVDASLQPDGYQVRLRCDQESFAPFWVKVMAGATPRYQDGYDLRCFP